MAGWQADEIRLDYAMIKIIYRLNYLDFYFVAIIAMLVIVLEVHFSLLSLKKTYFRVYFMVHKIWSPFFSCQSLLLGTSIPNDMPICMN